MEYVRDVFYLQLFIIYESILHEFLFVLPVLEKEGVKLLPEHK